MGDMFDFCARNLQQQGMDSIPLRRQRHFVSLFSTVGHLSLRLRADHARWAKNCLTRRCRDGDLLFGLCSQMEIQTEMLHHCKRQCIEESLCV